VEYFGRASVEATEHGVFANVHECPAIEVEPGVVLRPVVGTALLLSHVTIEPHSRATAHSHDEEQAGLVIEGTCEFVLGAQTRMLGPGDVYLIPPGVVHEVRTGDARCVFLDVFSPPRAALVALLEARERSSE
jgi:quercetin dioxygenase-like cupin family protein